MADVRGESRVRTVSVVKGTEPTEQCTLHTFVDYCTEGKCLAGENCPAESVKQVGVLDYVREDYGETIRAEDDPYLLVNMQKAVEPQPPTEENPAGTAGGCPVHNQAPVVPDVPVVDPDDPNYDPSGGFGDAGMEKPGGETTPIIPAEPEQPTTPTEPTQPTDPSGGFGDAGGDWWQGFWEEQPSNP